VQAKTHRILAGTAAAKGNLRNYSVCRKSKIQIQILNYLLDHPSAEDTLEGIAQWWLLEQRIRTALSEVRVALNGLVAEKLLLASQRTDRQTHYRLNPKKKPKSTLCENLQNLL